MKMSSEIIILIIVIVEITKADHCMCVPFWQCSEEDSNFNEEAADPVDFRRITSNKIKPCSGFFDVCCTVRCGHRGLDSRLLGNRNTAKFAEFPWMLGIILENSYRCGGSLIHPKAALTAAHCVQIRGQYQVRAGEYNWAHIKEPLMHQDRTARKIVFHPDYDPRSLKNDIAVLILNRAFQLSESVGVACLPPRNRLISGDECVVSGWGRKNHRNKKYQSVLKFVELPTVPRNQCVRKLQEALLGPDFILHSSFICAGGEFHKDTCKGDGGSPLMCPVEGAEGKYQQVGIVSWGLTCGIRDTPGIYVNVAIFVDWIDSEMRKFHLDAQIYKY